MRKLVASSLVTLDGVLQDPGGFGELDAGGWANALFDDAARSAAVEQMRASDYFLCGRVTYELLSTAWSGNTGEYPDLVNAIPKLVASRTLRGPLAWNARVLDGDVVTELTELKRETGGDIVVYGSASLLRTLYRHDLVDEHHIAVYPFVLGEGKRLFPDGDRVDLRLVDATPLETGVVSLTYVPVRDR